MAKDFVWHELYDLMEENNCPVCALIEKRTAQAMDRFLFDSVNDRGLRKKMAEAHGFCNFHAHKLKEMGDPLAHAILYTDFLEQLTREMKENKPKKMKAYHHREHCLFCENAETGEKSYIPVMVEGFSDAGFVAKYEQGGLLCATHLTMFLEKCRWKQALAQKIIAINERKHQKIIEVLAEIKRKNDYQNQHEVWTEEEKLMWKKVVSVMNDGAGIRK